ncbi:MAG: hypothetical protein AAFU69_07215, partial [Pseudomonadota bacterium]
LAGQVDTERTEEPASEAKAADKIMEPPAEISLSAEASAAGENGQIPIYLAAWAPPIASLMLAIGILLHMEDG